MHTYMHTCIWTHIEICVPNTNSCRYSESTVNGYSALTLCCFGT